MATAWDSANKTNNVTLNTGLQAQGTAGTLGAVRSTTSLSGGKAYFEFNLGANLAGSNWAIGIVTTSFVCTGATAPAYVGQNTVSAGWLIGGPTFRINALGQSPTPEAIAFSAQDGSVAIDFSNGRMWVRKQGGNWNNSASGDPTNPTTGQGYDITSITGPFYVGWSVNNATDIININFGATAFTRSVPSGYSSWDTLAAGVSAGVQGAFQPTVTGFSSPRWFTDG